MPPSISVENGGRGVNEELLSFDRSGKPLGSVGQPGDYIGIALSPDEKRVAVHRSEGEGGDIWLIELLRGDAASRFTFNVAQRYVSPVWSPDGTQISFSGAGNIFRKISSGAGSDELLVKSEVTSQMNNLPTSWSGDGSFIIYQTNDPKTKEDLWVLPTAGDRKPFPFLRTEFNEILAQFSPNGRWVAYTSDESGTGEVYVQSFPRSNGKWKVSANGGVMSRWSKDGKEIFFISQDGKLWSVEVKPGTSTFEPGVPKLLFETRIASWQGASGFFSYDVSADGRRFLIASQPSDVASSEPITVVLNWTAELKKK
jgi:Tol biopolymer transport system component